MLLATSASVSRSTDHATPRILLVEDDEFLGVVVEEILKEDFQAEVERAFTADEAVEWLRVRSFDLVLTDIVMPGRMNGVDLAQLIRRDYPNLPVILSTGHAPSQTLPEVAHFPLLRKPYETWQLRRKLIEAGLQLEGAP